MSTNSNSNNSNSTPNREVAKRAFAVEVRNATETFAESDKERAPQFTVLPTGERANRIFIVGTLTDTKDVGDSGRIRAKISDPTGTFYVYAGQYQPNAVSTLRSMEPPVYVSLVGKFNQFENNNTGDTMVAIQPESITAVDEATQQRWVGETSKLTRERIDTFDEESNDSDRARDAYGSDLSEYEDTIENSVDDLLNSDNE